MKGIGMEETVPDQPEDRAALSSASTPEHPIEDTAAAPAMAKSPCPSPSSYGTPHCSSPLARLREARHVRSNSFQRWRRQIQRAWRWGPTGGNNNNSGRDQGFKTTLNLEVMANQKRQWYQIHSKSRVLFYCFRPFSFMPPERKFCHRKPFDCFSCAEQVGIFN